MPDNDAHSGSAGGGLTPWFLIGTGVLALVFGLVFLLLGGRNDSPALGWAGLGVMGVSVIPLLIGCIAEGVRIGIDQQRRVSIATAAADAGPADGQAPEAAPLT